MPPSFSCALDPSKLSVCSANNLQRLEETPCNSAEAPGEPSCFALISGEGIGSCQHHSHKLRQGSGSLAERRSWKGDAALSQVGTTGVRLIRLIGFLRLWMKRKSSMSAGNFAHSEPNSPWLAPQREPGVWLQEQCCSRSPGTEGINGGLQLDAPRAGWLGAVPCACQRDLPAGKGQLKSE